MTIGIIGAGTMGNGIAQVCALAGLQTVMLDVSSHAVERGVGAIRSSLERLQKKEKLEAHEMGQVLSRIRGTTDYAALTGASLVIEAATENLALKKSILQTIDGLVAPTTVIATNTSSISITELAAGISTPQRFIGIHFFNPVPVMELVEIIRGLQTSEATYAAAMAFVNVIGKTPITTRNSPGFAVNRILCPMLNEAIFALQEGLATADELDAGMVLGCNHPIGPLALADMIGLDTLLEVLNVFYDGFSDSKYRPAPLLKEMVAAGYLGRKSGRGFYQYEANLGRRAEQS